MPGTAVCAMRSPSSVDGSPHSIDRDIHVLDLGVEVERFHAKLAANAAHLVSAKWGLYVNGGVGVHTQHSGADSPYHSDGPTDISRPDRSGEPVLRVVRQAHGLLLIAKRDNADHR